MSKKKILRDMERKIVNQNKKEISEPEIEELEHKLQEDSRESSEGMGIEEEEFAGSEPTIEFDKIMKDPDEDEEED